MRCKRPLGGRIGIGGEDCSTEIAADHGGFLLKEELTESLRGSGYEVVDFGAYQLTPYQREEQIVMPMKLHEDGEFLEAQLSGQLVKEDYSKLVLAAERLLKTHGKIRILLDMHDFHGWTAGAAWEDIKFDAKHFNDIERLAVVGETKWEHAMAALSKPFTGAKVHWFDRAERAQADAWLQAV